MKINGLPVGFTFCRIIFLLFMQFTLFYEPFFLFLFDIWTQFGFLPRQINLNSRKNSEETRLQSVIYFKPGRNAENSPFVSKEAFKYSRPKLRHLGTLTPNKLTPSVTENLGVS